jgi:subtilisin family serine protease
MRERFWGLRTIRTGKERPPARLPQCSTPARLHHVLCVGAVDKSGFPTGYSNGDAVKQSQFLVAPGASTLGGQFTGLACDEEIFSTALRSGGIRTRCYQRGYDVNFGTSAAAPHVSGVAALLVALGLNNEEIVQRLVSTAEDLGEPGRDPLFGFGLVDAQAATSLNRT